ncbi:MAG TPA: hypothetical protein VJP89_15565 [Pyrinomonadaceae bacterium]|nr:hypothetical protein [Pyrinomonadaceae bacterium]
MTSLLLSIICVITAVPLFQAQDARQNFWQQFKTAVTNRDAPTVARLSQFPIRMSYGIPSIKTKAQLTKRFRQVFNEQTDAAACFGKAKPEVDPANAKAFTVACPDAAGNEVVIYHFQQTKAGWRFTALDNLNE